jgi:hypothetical protein
MFGQVVFFERAQPKNALVNPQPPKNWKRLSIVNSIVCKHTVSTRTSARDCKRLHNFTNTITILQIKLDKLHFTLQFDKDNFTSTILQALLAPPQSKCQLWMQYHLAATPDQVTSFVEHFYFYSDWGAVDVSDFQ